MRTECDLSGWTHDAGHGDDVFLRSCVQAASIFMDHEPVTYTPPPMAECDVIEEGERSGDETEKDGCGSSDPVAGMDGDGGERTDGALVDEGGQQDTQVDESPSRSAQRIPSSASAASKGSGKEKKGFGSGATRALS